MSDYKNPDATDDTNFFWQSKYGPDRAGSGPDQLVDVTDAYANHHKFYISFYHLGSAKTVFFKAFVNSYREDFVSNWNEQPVYGRTDSIVTYANTRRKISLSFAVPAASESEAYENMGRLQRLIQFQYPTYHTTAESEIPGVQPEYVIGQSPLVRLKMMNLIASTNPTSPEEMQKYQDMSRSRLIDEYVDGGNSESGLLVAITNLSIDSEIDKNSVFEKAQGTVLPQSFRVTLDFIVLHDNTVGFKEDGSPIQEGYPWKIILKEPSVKEATMTFSDTNSRINMARNNQAAEDIAKSRYGGMFGNRRAENELVKWSTKKDKPVEGSFGYEMAKEAEKYYMGEDIVDDMGSVIPGDT